MGKIKRMIMAFALAAMIMLPTAATHAGSVSFTNFNFKTYANTEVWTKVIGKSKADSEQAWYLTLTGSQNLSSNYVRAIAIAYDVEPPYGMNKNYVDLTPSTGAAGATPYNKTVYKGSTYYLWVSGNENNYYDFSITITGRFTS